MRESRITAALIAGIFVIYAVGACRTIYVGDSGELTAAAAVLGIPHPSGYPLYVLLGKLFLSVFSLGSVPFRMSIFSAVCAAMACGLLYRIVREMSMPRRAGILAALVLAFHSYWRGQCERGTANAVFVCAATLCAFRGFAIGGSDAAAAF